MYFKFKNEVNYIFIIIKECFHFMIAFIYIQINNKIAIITTALICLS
jgi:hypothetical protein